MAELLLAALQTILTPLGWFLQLLVSADAYGVYLGMFAAVVVVRLFIKPIIGGDGKVGED